MASIDPNLLNLAAFHPGTFALGPGKRAVLWVQGCPFSCKGCIAPEWIPFEKANIVDPFWLAEKILSLDGIEGITISGGEPMLQAGALTSLVAAVFAIKPLNIITFTGFTLEKLIKNPPNENVPEFLEFIDVLIDGQYIEYQNDDKSLRGSANQRFHHLTKRLLDFDFENSPRNVELFLQGNESFLVGIPRQDFFRAYNQAFTKFVSLEV